MTDGVTEFCKECRAVWGTGWSSACCDRVQGGCGTSAEPAFSAAAQRDQQPAFTRCAHREWGVSFPEKDADMWRWIGVADSERPRSVRGLEGRHCCDGRADYQSAEEAGGAVGGEGYAGKLEAHNGADRNVQVRDTETGMSSRRLLLSHWTVSPAYSRSKSRL